MSLSAAPLIDCEVNSIYYCGEWWNKCAKRSGTSTLIKLVKIRSWPALSSSFMRKSTIDLRGANLVNVCCCCCFQVARALIFYFDFIGMLIWIIVSSWPSFRYVAAFMRTQWNFMFLCGALMGQFSDGDRKKTHTREDRTLRATYLSMFRYILYPCPMCFRDAFASLRFRGAWLISTTVAVTAAESNTHTHQHIKWYLETC